MSKTYSEFLDAVMPDVPGATNTVVEAAIKNTIIAFCEKSLILQRDHDPLSTIQGVKDYDFEPSTSELVVKVMRAWFKSSELVPLAPDDIGRPEIYNDTFAGADTTQSDPQYFLQKDERTFTLYPTPSATIGNAITMRVAFKPTRASTTVKDVLYEDYFEVIGHGAKYRLMSSIGKPYYNQAGAAAELAQYTVGVNAATQKAVRGHVRSDLSVRQRSA